jgi:hypothetical protein
VKERALWKFNPECNGRKMVQKNGRGGGGREGERVMRRKTD